MSDFEEDFDAEHAFDDLDEDSVEAKVWQFLLLINPGDEETALLQFTDYREAVVDVDADDIEPIAVIGRVIDWRSGFIIDAQDMRSLIQAVDELSSRWNLSIDWNGDPVDDEFFDDMDCAELFSIAYDRLAEHGYTLWAWETDGDTYAGFMTLTRDAEPLRELATALGINLMLGNQVS
jgi:hypothetical protein